MNDSGFYEATTVHEKHRWRSSGVETLLCSEPSWTLRKSFKSLKRRCKEIRKKVVENERRSYRTIRTKSGTWKTQEGRRAGSAGSVQQGNTNTSCCGGAAAGISPVFEDLYGPCGVRFSFKLSFARLCGRLISHAAAPSTGGVHAHWPGSFADHGSHEGSQSPQLRCLGRARSSPSCAVRRVRVGPLAAMALPICVVILFS